MGISSENHGWDPCDGGFEGEHQLQKGSMATFDYRTVNQWEHLRCLDYHLTSCSFSCFTLKLRDGWSKLQDAQEFSYVFITRREIWKKNSVPPKNHTVSSRRNQNNPNKNSRNQWCLTAVNRIMFNMFTTFRCIVPTSFIHQSSLASCLAEIWTWALGRTVSSCSGQFSVFSVSIHYSQRYS